MLSNLRFVLSVKIVLSNLRFVLSNRIHKDPVYRSRNPRVLFSRVLVRPLSSTGIVICLGLLGLLWVTKYCCRTGTTACLLDASGRGSTHLPSKKTTRGKKKYQRREDGKAAMDPPTSCPLGRVDVKLNCDIVKLLRSTVVNNLVC